MAFRIVTNHAAILEFIRDVQAAADTDKEALGFLPAAAYEEAAHKGEITVVLSDQAQGQGMLAIYGSAALIRTPASFSSLFLRNSEGKSYPRVYFARRSKPPRRLDICPSKPTWRLICRPTMFTSIMALRLLAQSPVGELEIA